MGNTINKWDQVEVARDWKGLLLGNGLSINVWKNFSYRSLFEEAQADDGPLTADDLALFAALGTENFEVALHALMTAGRVATALGQPSQAYADRYASIQNALGHAVRRVHPHLSHVPDDARRTIKSALLNYKSVFTTNYDLLLYWSMGHPDTFYPTTDCLIGAYFNPQDCAPFANKTPVYFLHGALHLVVKSDGVTHKIVKSPNENVLDQFGLPFDGDSGSHPLLITEGASADKLRAIDGNSYLRHAWDQLRNCRAPLVVFGSTLSADQDGHVVDAINLHPKRSVAVAIHPSGAAKQQMKDIRYALDTESLYFFDSTTHPLGATGWQAESEKLASFSVTL